MTENFVALLARFEAADARHWAWAAKLRDPKIHKLTAQIEVNRWWQETMRLEHECVRRDPVRFVRAKIDKGESRNWSNLLPAALKMKSRAADTKDEILSLIDDYLDANA